ncbi:protein phosphatase [Geomicrobium halophilum]|uniref:protein-serine/threonine phosphatase n=1 Tax=Geomicrobium halophilum TaxID=549000 RepID=A0A841PQ81_9BACL|nr:Stp1/IreP family PP2C-type Ser/Thr phosphatase [Geomicrobium halophilum]MBB6449346.1 protein phosphatase [Geomicrobium halophilum]
MEAVFRTDVGKLREHNEDAGDLFYKEDMILAIVADGMGGHRAGDVASEMAVKALKDAWDHHPPKNEYGAIKRWLTEEIQRANDAVFQKSIADESYRGMGTTLVASVIYEGGLVIGHVGDSRAYRLQPPSMVQLTSDHSLVNELVKSGQLKPEEAENHPRKNVVTRALGTQAEVEVEVGYYEFPKQSTLLLCSDGLSDKLLEKDIEETLLGDREIDGSADALVQKALERGGEDNITVLLVYHNVDGEGHP